MFNVGGAELLVILVIALIVLGPQRLPHAARQVGKTMSELRRLSTGFQNEVKSALDAADDTTRTSDRRNVLDAGPARTAPSAPEAPEAAAEAEVDAAVDAAVDAVTESPKPAARRRRDTPLRAAPLEPPEAPGG